MTTDTQAIFLDLDTVGPDDLSLQNLKAVVPSWQMMANCSREELVAVLQGKHIAVSNKVVLDKETLTQCSDLRLICVAATGTNNVDLDAARELGIDVCNATAYATPSVVQYVFSVLLSLYGRIDDYRQRVYDGSWSNSPNFCLLDFPFYELNGKTLGIYGYGELGRAVAGVAQMFGMQVLIAQRDADDQRTGRIALHDMLPQLDVLSLHCPLTPETQNRIDETELALMPKGSILINSARGGIVNETALINYIENGHLGGAATDVLTKEPPPADHPLLAYRHPRLIVTPHIAWASIEARQRLLDQVALNISEYLAGRPRNRVN